MAVWAALWILFEIAVLAGFVVLGIYAFKVRPTYFDFAVIR